MGPTGSIATIFAGSLFGWAAADLLVPAVLPPVHQVLEALDVPLCVEDDRPEHGLVRALVQRFLERFELYRACLFSCLGKGLDRGVGIQRVTLGAEALGLEPLDHLSRRGQLAWFRAEGHQRTLSGRAGKVPVLLSERARSHHHRCGQATTARLAHEKAGLGKVTTEVN